jgi:protein SCO1/2
VSSEKNMQPECQQRVRLLVRVLSFLLLTAQCSLLALAQYAQPPVRQATTSSNAAPILKDIRIEQHLGRELPLDTPFRDEAGQAVKLGDYFGRRPVALALVYYNCPMLCNQVLAGLIGGLREVPFEPGRDFDVVVVSFDPREGPLDAQKKKKIVLGDYRKPATSGGWHFLTGDKAAIDALADAVGFRFAYDAQTDQFAHASGIMLATQQGKLSHYFYGVEYPPRELRLGLVEASAGKIGSPVDQLLLYCYHYDPTTGRYGPVIMNVLRLAGIITVLGLLTLILILRRYKPRPVPTEDAAAAGGTA